MRVCKEEIMEQVPFMCDGIYLEKQKSTVPNFWSFGEYGVTDGCKHMAWFGEIGGEKRYLF